MLSLQWSGALRRSELVGLDWEKLGTGRGFVSLSDEGITITLMTSKASQTQAETVVVPRIDMPTACTALEHWIAMGQIAPGTPIFRRIRATAKVVGPNRLQVQAVNDTMKRCIVLLDKIGGKKLTKEQKKALMQDYSGHSARAGYATSAARRNVPSYRIQAQTRHKSADMVQKYVREGERFSHSGLKGVGF
jgi:integrase